MSSVFNLRKQLTFYGAYHSDPANVLIHVACVPLLQWSAWYLTSFIPTKDYLPEYHVGFTEHLIFNLNIPTIHAAISIIYYFLLDPGAAALYVPQGVAFILSACALAENRPDLFYYVLGAHIVAWILQFIGHGFAEKRAPALLDNVFQAIILAPFFVHMEMLFSLWGYKPELQKQLRNDVSVEIARIRKIEGDKKRAKANGAKKDL